MTEKLQDKDVWGSCVQISRMPWITIKNNQKGKLNAGLHVNDLSTRDWKLSGNNGQSFGWNCCREE